MGRQRGRRGQVAASLSSSSGILGKGKKGRGVPLDNSGEDLLVCLSNFAPVHTEEPW